MPADNSRATSTQPLIQPGSDASQQGSSVLPYADARAAANAKLRAGGYNVNLDPGDDDDTPLPGAADRAKRLAIAAATAGTAPAGSVIDAPGASQAPLRDIMSLESAITGTPDTSPRATVPGSGPTPAPIAPHQFFFDPSKPVTIDQVTKVATAGGLDVSKLPDGYLQSVVDRYTAARDPGILEGAKFFIQSSRIGHFMQGFNKAGSPDVLDPDIRRKIDPEQAESYKADMFFNQNIQARIIDGGRYINSQNQYNPPKDYQAGDMIASALTPTHVAMGLAGTVGAVVLARAGLAGLAGSVGLYERFAARSPAMAKLIGVLAQGTAFGAAVKMFGSGGSAPAE